ncbi:MAG: YbaB/EbfC family nucleoid-associated protein [Spirochaetaceae bacterium]|nr:YbaB/EbfC family nucleoid-associated protein [Spirochaetaceae bacterium]
MNIDPMELLKNFQGIQNKVGEFQSKLSSLTVAGYAGGDMVKVEIDGHMQVLDIRITKEVVPQDPNDTGMLEELIKAAFNDAVRRMKEKINEEVSSMTGGINIPGMMPFGN